jgi:tetratricopeptide (TPR) repeat protein
VRARTSFASSWSAVVVLAALAGLARAESASFTGVVDLAGRHLEALPLGRGPTVLVFTRTDCPISNRYAPELRRLGERFARRGVFFRLVYADPTETRNNLGGALLETGRVAEAVEQLRRAVETDPGSLNAQYNLGRALALRGRLDEAAAHLEQALRIQADDPDARRELAAVRARQARRPN